MSEESFEMKHAKKAWDALKLLDDNNDNVITYNEAQTLDNSEKVDKSANPEKTLSLIAETVLAVNEMRTEEYVDKLKSNGTSTIPDDIADRISKLPIKFEDVKKLSESIAHTKQDIEDALEAAEKTLIKSGTDIATIANLMAETRAYLKDADVNNDGDLSHAELMEKTGSSTLYLKIPTTKKPAPEKI